MRNVLMLIITCCMALPSSLMASGYKGDTVSITLQEAEGRFVKGNLVMLATQYNVEATRALILQAKLFDNPHFDYSQSLYNYQTKEWFPTSTTSGQFSVSVQQLIHIAGQRNANIKLQKLNTQTAEYNLFDLMRTLKYQLRTDFFTLGYALQSLKVYDLEINSITDMSKAYEEQALKGNVSEKEALRLKALLLSLLNERNTLNDQINSMLSDFRTLLADTTGAYYKPILDESKSDTFNVEKLNIPNLIDVAFNNRNDVKASETALLRDQQNLKLQRRIGVPDLSAGFDYQRNSSFPNQYYGIDLNIDLPFFNRNQGNIKAAKYTIKATEANKQLNRLQVDEDVIQAYTKALQYDRLYKQTDKTFAPRYEKLLGGVLENFQKRNISLIDFVDYYDSYKSNAVQWNLLKATRINAIEQLNYATGVDNFSY